MRKLSLASMFTGIRPLYRDEFGHIHDSSGQPWRVRHEYGGTIMHQYKSEVFLLQGFKVKVKTGEVISKLLEKRAEHVEQYEEARLAYLGKIVKAADRLGTFAQLALDGKAVKGEETPEHSNYFTKIDKPTLHVHEYDNALGILRLHVDENIELDMDAYKKFYLNEWQWRHFFDSSYASNTGKRAK